MTAISSSNDLHTVQETKILVPIKADDIQREKNSNQSEFILVCMRT